MNMSKIEREYYGRGSLVHIRGILDYYNISDLFLVSGGDSFALSGAKEALMPLLERYAIHRFSDFTQNPKIEDVEKGIDALRKTNAGAVVAVGGGSTVDMAKLINVLARQPAQDKQKIVTGTKNIGEKGLPFVAIPTTSGSGSEATHFAVVYIDKRKYSLAHGFIKPDHTILDPSLTDSMTAYLAACSGMDALCQAVESYWSVASTTESMRFSSQAITMILSAIKQSVCNGDRSARDKMMRAANLSGKAINITKTTAPHAISYPFTTYFNIPHGHAVALILGRFFSINMHAGPELVKDSRGWVHLKRVMREIELLFGCSNTATPLKKTWYDLMVSLGLEVDMKKMGFCGRSDMDLILNNINMERLNNHPIKVTREMVSALLTEP